jgi:hypothetical protein
MADPATLLASTTPNSKPREQQPKKVQTYVYQDYANAEPASLNTGAGTCHERVPPQSLQSQKLPSKLGAMLSDPDLTSVITWMPHGRSWKILDRESFANFALPRYFGHTNHASFVRIINAWGFRRVTKGPDRDTYYHELFLRGKPRLHERMKRLPTCHRKTPIDKEDKCPDFYALAKTSPLPEVEFSRPVAGNLPANQAPAGFPGASLVTPAAANPYAGFGLGGAGSLSAYPIQGNDMLLQLIRQQGAQGQGVNPSLMYQMLFSQASNPGGTLGQLANAAAFGQRDTTGSSLMSADQGMNSVPQRRLSNDGISMNDIVQMRSIERTNKLLTQKLAMLQQGKAANQDANNAPASSNSKLGTGGKST